MIDRSFGRVVARRPRFHQERPVARLREQEFAGKLFEKTIEQIEKNSGADSSPVWYSYAAVAVAASDVTHVAFAREEELGGYGLTATATRIVGEPGDPEASATV